MAFIPCIRMTIHYHIPTDITSIGMFREDEALFITCKPTCDIVFPPTHTIAPAEESSTAQAVTVGGFLYFTGNVHIAPPC